MFCDFYFKDHLPNIEKYIYIEIDGKIKEYRSDISINVIDNSVSKIDKSDINIYISCSNNYKFMYDPFIKTTIDICLKIYNIIPIVNGNLNMIQPGDMFIFIGCDKMPDFNKFKKKGVKTIFYWTEPFTLHTQAEEIWLYGRKLYNDQLNFTKDKLIKFVPILYEPKLPIMDYSKDSKLELIFLGDLRWRVKQRKYVESIQNFKCIYDIWDDISYNHFITNHKCIFLNLNKGDSKYIPSARISKILSHGGIIISEHCDKIDETLYEGLVYFTSVDKIKDLFIFFMNKTPLELLNISNDILLKFIKKFTVENMIQNINKHKHNIYISTCIDPSPKRFMYEPFINTCSQICKTLYKEYNCVIGKAPELEKISKRGDILIYIGHRTWPNFDLLKKKGVKTIFYWTEPCTFNIQVDEMWLYGRKLYNDQLNFTKDRIIKFVPILYEPKLPIMDYSKDSKLELIFLGHIDGRPKYKRDIISSIDNFKIICNLWDNKSYNHFITNHRCIFLNLNKGDSKYIPSARISKILSHGGIIISEHCSSIDEELYEGLVYFTSVDKIKDLFIFFMNKTPLELLNISNDILLKFCKKFTVENMIS
jgi:hypothetical protein